MPDHCANTVLCNPADLRQAFSIHTRKITDSCRDKDCIEDLRVWLTRGSQGILDKAATAKVRCADLINTYIEVEPVAFDRNHYCVDVTFFYRIVADAIVGNCRPVSLQGVAMFSKRAVLCGEDSKAHVFTSDNHNCGDALNGFGANRPTAVVEVVAPISLTNGAVSKFMRQRHFMQILSVGEAFRLPWDGKPVPYSPEYSQFRVIIHFETGPFIID